MTLTKSIKIGKFYIEEYTDEKKETHVKINDLPHHQTFEQTFDFIVEKERTRLANIQQQMTDKIAYEITRDIR